MHGRSVLEGGACELEGSKTYNAQLRIGLANFSRFKEPVSARNTAFHGYERSTMSSSCFREQLLNDGKLTKQESNDLMKLEKQMNQVHPLVEAVIFLGKEYATVFCTLYFIFV